ncbi:aspartic proteinase nepenthesin-1-like [Tasmannia lanceolata]|uniref:aspartic proteinase nepenthesin-1-like n=1 Tax=Tasmannia lanceolata TaxID=3420 RepID=UPI004062AF8A
MLFSKIFIFVFFLFLCGLNAQAENNKNPVRSNGSLLHGIEFPDHMTFNSITSSQTAECQPRQDEIPNRPALKLHLKHRTMNPKTENSKLGSLREATYRDLTRIHTLNKRIIESKNQNTVSRITEQTQRQLIRGIDEKGGEPMITNQLVATLESGVSLGSGEYFIDVFVGTPPKHFSLILDTGSDLNWIQCLPCIDCFEQKGPPYNPRDSSSFHNITCNDPRCQLVSSPDPPRPCTSSDQTCQYFYWYGDRSNTTGDFALETFTVNLTTTTGDSELRTVEHVMFGCGHWNRGLFHGAAGLLGLGRGPLSFSSQLQSLYGHTFSYCLVDRNSNISVSSKLIFGEDKSLMSHPNLNFTSLVTGKENPVDTFYYVQIKSIMVGREILNIPTETWRISPEGAGGTIIDSGTTLSYFADPAYQIIKQAFVKKVKDYPVVTDFPLLEPCYNVSGVEKVELPEFTIVFEDGAVWDFPAENYFIRIDPEEIVCLAIMGTPRSSLSILGNYQQQNFHIMYDTKKSRLGFAPMRCADV